MRVSKRKVNSSGIDISPMLDVIFQLILFFLVSTTFAVVPGISVKLPNSSTSQGTDASGITITVEENGEIYFNDKIATIESLGSFLKTVDVGTVSKDIYPVTISADEKVQNGTIVKIFDELRKEGFVSVSLRTKSVL